MGILLYPPSLPLPYHLTTTLTIHFHFFNTHPLQEEEIVPLLNPVAKAMRLAQLKLLEQGFEEQAEVFSSRKKAQSAKLRKKKKESAKEEGRKEKQIKDK